MSIEFYMRSITEETHQSFLDGDFVPGHVAESSAVSKSWDVLARILANGRPDATPLVAQSIVGGTKLDDGVDDYGGTRMLSPSLVADISASLETFDESEIERRHGSLDFTGCYGAGLDGSPASPADDYVYGLRQLRDFYGEAARAGHAMLIWLG
jgi:hypothetical protein